MIGERELRRVDHRVRGGHRARIHVIRCQLRDDQLGRITAAFDQGLSATLTVPAAVVSAETSLETEPFGLQARVDKMEFHDLPAAWRGQEQERCAS